MMCEFVRMHPVKGTALVLKGVTKGEEGRGRDALTQLVKEEFEERE